MVLQKKSDMRHPELSRHYGEPGFVAPYVGKPSLSGACPNFSVISVVGPIKGVFALGPVAEPPAFCLPWHSEGNCLLACPSIPCTLAPVEVLWQGFELAGS